MQANKGFVITGDIENFTSLNQHAREKLINETKIFIEGLVDQSSHAQIFRGDSYQLYFADAKKCLLALIKLRCWFLTYGDFELQIRNSLGVGKVAYINDHILESDGEAFHLSGRTFDKLRKGEFLVIKTSDSALDEQLHIMTMLMNLLIRKWTKQQGEVITAVLNELNQTKIANELKISQGAVNSRLKLSNWKEISETISYLQTIL